MSKARNVFVLLAVVVGGLGGSLALMNTASAHSGHTVSIGDATHAEGTAVAPLGDPNEDTSNVSVTVTINPAPQPGETITVPYATNSGATPPAEADPSAPVTYGGGCDPGCDYPQSSGSVVFDNPLSTTETISIPVLQDRTDEVDERFNVQLGTPVRCEPSGTCSSSGAAVTDGLGVVTITDDDGTPSIVMLDTNADEDDGTLNATARMNGASERNVTVNFATANNSAVAPGDYTARTGTFAFPNSNDSFREDAQAVTIVDDTLAEGPENFFVNLSGPTNSTIADSQGVQTINDNEAPVISVSNASAEEGSPLLFRISISTPPDAIGETATVNYETVDGTAVAPGDYTSRSGSVTFQPFQTQPHTVEVPTIQDGVSENPETMILRISKPTNCCTNFDYQIVNSDGTGVIRPETPGHDFNGDGFADSAFGAPTEDVGKRANAGAINVIYGDSSGISPTTPSDQVWHLNSSGVLGSTGDQDRFGSALGFGDFNSDGFDDIAVGIPGESGKAGAVSVIYGSSTGLTSTNNQLWSQNAGANPNEVEETSEAGDAFGTSLAGGDFNGDGFDDLAVGVPGEDVGGVADAGAVNVLLGSASGLTSTNDQLWSQDPLSDTHEAGDRFGFSVAAGDLNGDGRSDLVIGVPGEDVGTVVDAGAANVVYGGSSGLTAAGDQFWNQETTEDASETGDAFGYSVAAGDINGDGFGDAVFGVPREDITTKADAGGVNVVYGSSSTGLVATGGQFFSQDTTAVEGASETNDLFGFAVAIGDFNGDARGDLSIGVPLESIGSKANAGAANVLYGSASNVSTTNNQLFSQDATGIVGKAEKNDLFGVALSVGDYNGDDRDDLLIGARSEDFGTTRKNGGMAHAIYGAAAGLSSTGNEAWHQNVANVGGGIEKGDGFGSAVL